MRCYLSPFYEKISLHKKVLLHGMLSHTILGKIFHTIKRVLLHEMLSYIMLNNISWAKPFYFGIVCKFLNSLLFWYSLQIPDLSFQNLTDIVYL